MTSGDGAGRGEVDVEEEVDPLDEIEGKPAVPGVGWGDRNCPWLRSAVLILLGSPC